MSFIRKTILYFLLPISLLLIIYFISDKYGLVNYSPLKKNKTDSIKLLQLHKAGIVSSADSIRIYNACMQWFDTALKPAGFNGGMLVAKNGKIIFEIYAGTAHIPGSDSITANTPMHIASISKTFTAMAVLKLMQDGKLELNDEFAKYFPGFNYPGVTIFSLLTHRSGLPNYNYFMADLGWDKKKYVSNEDVLDYLITRKPSLTNITAPNTHFSYCNTNYSLLALLIEKVSGMKYADFLKTNFFVPLQMKNSYVFTLADTVSATPSYDWRSRLEVFNFLDQVYGDKNIYTTPRDLLIWDRALKSNSIFTEETIKLAYAPYNNEKPGIRNYGLGWRMNIFPNGNKIIYHNGWWHGSNAAFIRLIKEDATIIVIGNKFTRNIYHANVITSLFGDYYTPPEEESMESSKIETIKSDSSITTPILKMKSNKVRIKKKH